MPFIKSLSSRFTKYYFSKGSYLPLFNDFANNCANIFCIKAMILIFLNFIKCVKDKRRLRKLWMVGFGCNRKSLIFLIIFHFVSWQTVASLKGKCIIWMHFFKCHIVQQYNTVALRYLWLFSQHLKAFMTTLSWF